MKTEVFTQARFAAKDDCRKQGASPLTRPEARFLDAAASLLLAVILAAPLPAQASKPYRGRVLVVITCHADDFSIFAGGTIAKLIDQGYTAYLVRLTDDEKSGGADPQRNAAANARETQEVARIIGLKATYSLNFKNDELQRVPHEQVRDGIIYYLRKLQADTIYTFDPYVRYGEENPDHLVTARAAEDAAQNAWNPLYCPEQLHDGVQTRMVVDGYYWARGPIDVNVVTDTSHVLNRKMEALDHHRAQFPASDVAYYRGHDEAVGKIYGMTAAEVSHHIWFHDQNEALRKSAVRSKQSAESKGK